MTAKVPPKMTSPCAKCLKCPRHAHNKDLDVVLAGNPNVGKSVIFNQLCGSYAEVSNYPGTTVSTPSATIPSGTLTDTPGVYSLGCANEEEIIASRIIKKAELAVNVVSALSLERDLFLTLELLEAGLPCILVINQCDEAKEHGLEIDERVLEELLGIPAIKTVAIQNSGIDELKQLIENIELQAPRAPKYHSGEDDEDTLYSKRRDFINKIIAKAQREDSCGPSWSTRLGNALLNPFVGGIMAALVLLALYEFIGVFVARDIVDGLGTLFSKYYSPNIEKIINSFVNSEVLRKILTGEFGLLTMTVQYLLGVILPLVVAFNIFIAFLEDSGYLPRLAVLCDRFLTKLGLNGKAIIPIVLGFGCTTMAIISTRILNTKRERTIATALLGLTVPCSAQLGIIVGILAVCGGLKAWMVYSLVMFAVFAFAGVILDKIMPKKSSDLLLDIPPIRLPRLKNILRKTFYKTKHFLLEATPLFFLGSFLISVLDITGALKTLQYLLSPLTTHLLRLPAETANIFIMGLIRRDFGAAGLMSMADVMTSAQILVSLVVITLFVPCIASTVVLYKEQGPKAASLIWFGSWVTAFSVGTALMVFLRAFGY